MGREVGILERSAIEALLTEFHYLLDKGRGGEVAAMFTDDAVVETSAYRLEGRAAIEESFTARAGTKLMQHNWTSLRLTRLAGDRYRAESNTLIAVGELPPPQKDARIVMGTSTDEIVFGADGKPRFAHRLLATLFEGAIQG